jgi:hypothetical protein
VVPRASIDGFIKYIPPPGFFGLNLYYLESPARLQSFYMIEFRYIGDVLVCHELSHFWQLYEGAGVVLLRGSGADVVHSVVQEVWLVP